MSEIGLSPAFLNHAPGFDILSSMLHRLLCISAVFALSSFALPETVQILNKDGKVIEGPTGLAGFTVSVNGSTRKIVLSDVLSVHSGEPASPCNESAAATPATTPFAAATWTS